MTTEQTPQTASKSWWPRLTSGWLRPYGPWLVAIVLAGALVWQHQSAQRRQAALQTQLEAQRVQFETRIRTAVTEQTRVHLVRLMKAFVWAVRSAWLRDNLDEVNQYFNQMIKEEPVREVLLVDAEGRVLVATDKKHEGRLFADLFPAQLLLFDDVQFLQAEAPDTWYLAAPVVALHKKVGTLVMVYQSEVPLAEPLPSGEARQQAAPAPSDSADSSPAANDTL